MLKLVWTRSFCRSLTSFHALIALRLFRNPLWYRLHNTVCSRCAKDFHTTDRLFRHVYRVANCHMFYLSDVASMSSDQLATVDAADKLKKKDSKAILVPPVKISPP